MTKRILILAVSALIICLGGCGKTGDFLEEQQGSVQQFDGNGTEDSLQESSKNGEEGNPAAAGGTKTDILAPSKEQVLDMRAACLAGMSEEEISRLCENIKVANLTLEDAYLNDRLFDRLSDSDDLYWNYVDQKQEILISYMLKKDQQYDGSTGLTYQEYAKEYGEPVTVYNRFDAENFKNLMSEMRDSLKEEVLKPDFDALIENMELAQETHNVTYIKEIYYILHDMDYYLLRYAPEDLGKYIDDWGTITKYYGVLGAYKQ